MVRVYAYYEDGTDVEFTHIIKISYVGYDKTIDVLEENLTTHLFPIGQALWLHSNDGISVVNGNGLRFIEIKRE